MELDGDWREAEIGPHGIVRSACSNVDGGGKIEEDSIGPSLGERGTEENQTHEAHKGADSVVELQRLVCGSL